MEKKLVMEHNQTIDLCEDSPGRADTKDIPKGQTKDMEEEYSIFKKDDEQDKETSDDEEEEDEESEKEKSEIDEESEWSDENKSGNRNQKKTLASKKRKRDEESEEEEKTDEKKKKKKRKVEPSKPERKMIKVKQQPFGPMSDLTLPERKPIMPALGRIDRILSTQQINSYRDVQSKFVRQVAKTLTRIMRMSANECNIESARFLQHIPKHFRNQIFISCLKEKCTDEEIGKAFLHCLLNQAEPKFDPNELMSCLKLTNISDSNHMIDRQMLWNQDSMRVLCTKIGITETDIYEQLLKHETEIVNYMKEHIIEKRWEYISWIISFVMEIALQHQRFVRCHGKSLPWAPLENCYSLTGLQNVAFTSRIVGATDLKDKEKKKRAQVNCVIKKKVYSMKLKICKITTAVDRFGDLIRALFGIYFPKWFFDLIENNHTSYQSHKVSLDPLDAPCLQNAVNIECLVLQPNYQSDEEEDEEEEEKKKKRTSKKVQAEVKTEPTSLEPWIISGSSPLKKGDKRVRKEVLSGKHLDIRLDDFDEACRQWKLTDYQYNIFMPSSERTTIYKDLATGKARIDDLCNSGQHNPHQEEIEMRIMCLVYGEWDRYVIDLFISFLFPDPIDFKKYEKQLDDESSDDDVQIVRMKSSLSPPIPTQSSSSSSFFVKQNRKQTGIVGAIMDEEREKALYAEGMDEMLAEIDVNRKRGWNFYYFDSD